MTTHAISDRAYRSWQFSLRSLMFVTTIVAIGAAIVGASVVLAVPLVPLMAAAMLRTIRIAARQEATGAAKPRLFATFSRSVALIVATIAVAGMVGVLAILMAAIYVLRAARPIYRRLWRLLVGAKRKLALAVSRIEPVAILRWLEAQAVAGTISLVALCRRLFAQCWNGNGAGPITSIQD